MTACPSCGADNPDRARFSLECGNQLVALPAEVRKMVTVVFTDIVGSTNLGERLDPEAFKGVLTEYFVRMRDVIEQHGGLVEKYIGDAILGIFGIPQLHEDDALRAVRAATEMRAALRELNLELIDTYALTVQARTGVNTGEVLQGDISKGQTLALGDTVNVAARLEQAAGPDEILIGKTTFRLTRQSVRAEPIESGFPHWPQCWRRPPTPRIGGLMPSATWRLRQRLRLPAISMHRFAGAELAPGCWRGPVGWPRLTGSPVRHFTLLK